MESVTCDLCGYRDPLPYLEKSDRFTDQVFQYVTCSNCGLIYLDPRPTLNDIERYYPIEYEAYFVVDQVESRLERWHLLRALNTLVDFVEYYAQKGRLLDIGCSTGNFLMVAHQRGWDVTGVELAPNAAKIASEHYKLRVFTGTLETAHLSDLSYNVVTMWDVLEHLPNPARAVKECHRILASGGHFIFSIPNLASFDRALFGKNWIGWDAPRHFNLFNENTLIRLLSDAGFILIESRCILGAKGAFFLSLESAWGKLLNRRTRKLYPALSALLWPYRQISYALNKGPVITFAARKIE
jgi:SAM-dependent methyltransferase